MDGVQEVRHYYQLALGGVDVKVAHGRDAVSVEVDVTRPRQEGETFEEAAAASLKLAVSTYQAAVMDLEGVGVTVGPLKKAG
jgi:hypothetical protein